MAFSQATYGQISPGDIIATPGGNVRVNYTEENETTVTIYTQGGGITQGHSTQSTWVKDTILPEMGDYDILANAGKTRQEINRIMNRKRLKELLSDQGEPSSVPYTEEEIMNAAYSGADFSIGNSYPG